MIIKGLVDEDFLQYKKPAMFLIFPFCTFKCDIENGSHICQNWELAKAKEIEISDDKVVERYLNNPITSALVCGGLEPLDSFKDLIDLIKKFRAKTLDDIVIYTGYKPEEVEHKMEILKAYPNIIIKFGRFVPNHTEHFDEVLGITLASDNQFAMKIS